MSTPKTLYGATRLVPGPDRTKDYEVEGNTILCQLIDGLEGISTKIGTVIVPSYSSHSDTLAGGATLAIVNPIHLIKGNAGPQTIAGLSVGLKNGQLLTLVGDDATNKITILSTAANIQLTRGDITLEQYECLYLAWNSTAAKWIEQSRTSWNRYTNQQGIELYEARAGGSNKIILKAPAALASDFSLTLPTSLGIGGYVQVSSDGVIMVDPGPSNFWLNVVSFGADPTGVADSGAIIQGVINSALSGDIVYFPKGNYKIAAAGAGLLLHDKTNVTLEGEGARVFSTIKGTQTIANDGFVFIKLDGCIRCRVHGLDLDGGALPNNVVGLETCTNCVVEDCYIHNTAPTTPGNYSSDFASGIVSAIGHGNRFQRNRITAVFNGINTVTGSSGYEEDCLVTENTIWGTFVDGLTIKGKRIIVSNNSIRDLDTASALGVGISLGSNISYPSEDIIVIGNTINNCLQVGIELTNIAAHQAAKGFSISYNNVSDCVQEGILAANMLSGKIQGNVLRNCNAGGINLLTYGDGAAGDDQSHDVQITDNILCDTRTSDSRGTYGIRANLLSNTNSNCMTDIIISRNRIKNFKYAGLRLERDSTGTASKFQISGNHITDCSEYGLVITNGFTDILVDANIILGNSTSDIRYNIATDGNIQLINNRYGSVEVVDKNAYEAGTIIALGNGDYIISSDIDALGGYRHEIEGWHQENVAATQTNVILYRWNYVVTDLDKYYPTKSGSITGARLVSNAARVAGSCTVKILKTGSTLLGTLIIDGSHTTTISASWAKGTYTFDDTDYIQLTVTTSADWSPTSADISVTLEVET